MRPTVYLLFLNTLEDGVQKLKISCSVLLSNLVLFQGLKISQTSKISGERLSTILQQCNAQVRNYLDLVVVK